MEYVVKHCCGLKVIFQKEKNILNVDMILTSTILQIYRK